MLATTSLVILLALAFSASSFENFVNDIAHYTILIMLVANLILPVLPKSQAARDAAINQKLNH